VGDGRRYPEWFERRSPPHDGDNAEPNTKPMKLPTFTPESDWTPTPVSALPSWADARRVCVDLETRDPQLTTLGPGWRRDAYIVGIGFAIEDGPAHYVPIRHEGGGNVDVDHALTYFRDQAKVFTGPGRTIVGAGLQYDLDGLAQEGIEFQPEFFRDVQIAEPLLDELQFTYGLDAIAQRRGIPGKDESVLRQAGEALGLHPKKHLWMMHSKYVGGYGEQDVLSPLQILRVQERELEKEGLWSIYDLESRLLPVLVKMRRRGVRIDFDELDRVSAWASGEELKALAELKRQTGHSLTPSDVTKTAALVPVVRDMGVKIPQTDAGSDSLTKDFLATLDGPVGGLINRARRFNKLQGTFVKSRRAHAIGDRIHPTFNQLRSEKPGQDEDGGARYGRLSCSDPNLQQEPARDPEIGPRWRRVYVPDEGGEWCCNDYSQQEPRWAVHFAESIKEGGASDAGDKYRNDPNTDNHDMMATLINAGWAAIENADRKKRERDAAKQIFLGLCYGKGGAKLCHDLGLPTELVYSKRWRKKIEVAGPEGQALLDRFHRGVPWLDGTAKRAEKFARKNGYIKTVLGRKCRFPLHPGRRNKWDWTHKAFNRIIQGSSGDQIKKAMVDADAAGIRLQLQVHDELDLTIYDPQTARDLARIMRDAVPCSVPHKVDVEIGPNWAQIEKEA